MPSSGRSRGCHHAHVTPHLLALWSLSDNYFEGCHHVQVTPPCLVIMKQHLQEEVSPCASDTLPCDHEAAFTRGGVTMCKWHLLALWSWSSIYKRGCHHVQVTPPCLVIMKQHLQEGVSPCASDTSLLVIMKQHLQEGVSPCASDTSLPCDYEAAFTRGGVTMCKWHLLALWSWSSIYKRGCHHVQVTPPCLWSWSSIYKRGCHHVQVTPPCLVIMKQHLQEGVSPCASDTSLPCDHEAAFTRGGVTMCKWHLLACDHEAAFTRGGVTMCKWHLLACDHEAAFTRGGVTMCKWHLLALWLWSSIYKRGCHHVQVTPPCLVIMKQHLQEGVSPCASDTSLPCDHEAAFTRGGVTMCKWHLLACDYEAAFTIQFRNFLC